MIIIQKKILSQNLKIIYNDFFIAEAKFEN